MIVGIYIDLYVFRSADCFLSAEDHEHVSRNLRQLLSSTCQYTQERCAQLLSSKTIIWPEEKCYSSSLIE